MLMYLLQMPWQIYDEILVNAADNRQRDKNMRSIHIEVDPGGDSRVPKIVIFNDGRGIPVKVHDKEGYYFRAFNAILPPLGLFFTISCRSLHS